MTSSFVADGTYSWSALTMAPSTLIDRVAPLVASCELVQVRDVLRAGRTHEGLDGRLLEILAEAHWWLGAVDECIAVRRDAVEIHDHEGELRSAGRLALLLSEDYRRQGREVIGDSWRRRAAKLLDSMPECPEQGYLLLYQGEVARRNEDLEAARELVARAEGVARRVADSDLAADVKQEMGRIMIEAGAHSEGLATMDDAMLTASDGQLSRYTTGKIYCCVMSVRSNRRRATGVGMGTYLDDLVTTGRPLCLPRYVSRASRRSACPPRALVRGRTRSPLGLRRAARNGMGRRLRAHHDRTNPLPARRPRWGSRPVSPCQQLGISPDPGLSMLLHARGETVGGLKRLVRALSSTPTSALSRFRLLPTMVDLAIASNDHDLAATAVAEIEEIAAVYKTSKMHATATSARSQLALASGDWVSAAGLPMTAIHQWQELAAPYEVARARVVHARACRALDDHHSWETSLTIAANTFQSLGAVADLADVERLRGHHDTAVLADAGLLTARELEVLRLLATGVTNKAIAAELFVSQKTVSRYLSNIFTKLGVETRAAATAYAYEHDIVVKR